VDALLLGANNPAPITIRIAISATGGLTGLNYQAFMRSVAVPQPNVDAVLMSLSHVPAGRPTPALAGSMTILHVAQDGQSMHPKNKAIAAMVGPDFDAWFGNIVVVACSPDGSCFHNMDNVQLAHQCVMA
jgi:hypothetical protein